MMVPGSIPKMMIGFLCTEVIIFSTLIIELTLCIEQKYQNIHQVVPRTAAGSVAVLFPVSAGQRTARPGNGVGNDQNRSFWRNGLEVLARDRHGIY